MLRREFIASLVSLAATPSVRASTLHPGAKPGDPQPFDAEWLRAEARALAETPYVAPPSVPAAWTEISYDTYRKVQFDTRKAAWAGDPSVPLEVDLFPPGLYFPKPVTVNLVENGLARRVGFDLGVFHNTGELPAPPDEAVLGYSGIRLRAELRQPGIYEEFAVFQGASYFRAIGTGLTYGLSARGLAIDTAEPSGEEFPDFRSFWVEKPARDGGPFVVHALLDGPSCTGAYRFAIQTGQELVMEVEAEIFARRDIGHVGIAPLTSMFLFDATNRDRFSDFRSAVHDNDGLLIANGAGETLWRPLANPRTLQISAFLDRDPRGFGLMQRSRRFDDFSDLEALYHNRPGLWVEPGEGWGEGAVTLVEIPADKEIYDNIVAYWRPASPIPGGTSHRMTYRLTWGADGRRGQGLRVLDTRLGARGDGWYIVAIDFEAGEAPADMADALTGQIHASAGEVSAGVVQRIPETGGTRLSFAFTPGDSAVVELRAGLQREDRLISETWVYRWTA